MCQATTLNRSGDLKMNKEKKPIYKKIWFWLIIVVVVVSSVYFLKETYFKSSLNLQNEIKTASPKHVMIFAHRGMLYHNPEHSFAGYNENIKDGATIIEQDVHITKDNVLIVSHDDNLKRVTGHNVSIAQSNYSQIKKLKLRNGEHVHTLNQVLNKYKNKINYAIEANRGNMHGDRLEKKITETVNKYGLAKNTLIQDTDLNGLIVVHKQRNFRKVPTLWLETDRNFSKNYEHDIDNVPDYITFISMPLSVITPKIVNYVHKKHHLVNAWTMMTYDDNAIAKTLKVDSVFTNDAGFSLHYFKHSF